jgi:hypothetical protein
LIILSEEVKKGQREKADKRAFFPGTPPLGYILEKSARAKAWHADRWTQTTRRWPISLFEYYATGLAFTFKP